MLSGLPCDSKGLCEAHDSIRVIIKDQGLFNYQVTLNRQQAEINEACLGIFMLSPF